MNLKGECLACEKLARCRETNETLVLQSYTCSLFEAASEPVYLARWDSMLRYGEVTAVRAMLPLKSTTEGEDKEDG